ncbi:MAG: acyl-CoA thioesterase domain-containing protein [Rhodospirillales bacterium]
MDPLIARRLKFQQTVPFAHSIGLHLLRTEHGIASARLTPRPQISRAAGDPAIHPWALIGMADHALSYAFASLIPPTSGLSTLDLRLDFGARPIGAVAAEATVTRLATDNGTAILSATDETGATVLGASTLFNFRSFPGGQANAVRPNLPPFEIDHDGPFTDLLGLHQSGPEIWLQGGLRRTIGFEGLPALHGGVIGALLAAACEAAATGPPAPMRLATLGLRFLRPGGLARLEARANLVRAGRSAAFVTATCWHSETEPVAEAHATFAPPN